MHGAWVRDRSKQARFYELVPRSFALEESHRFHVLLDNLSAVKHVPVNTRQRAIALIVNYLVRRGETAL